MEDNDSEFMEEITIDQPAIRSQPRKLNSKIMKKTVLRKKWIKVKPPSLSRKECKEIKSRIFN